MRKKLICSQTKLNLKKKINKLINSNEKLICSYRSSSSNIKILVKNRVKLFMVWIKCFRSQLSFRRTKNKKK